MSKRQPAAHTDSPAAQMRSVAPPSKHQLAIMIWIAVFPTLTVLNLTLGPHLAHVSPVLGHLRARHHRGPDRHLRRHASTAPCPGPHPHARHGLSGPPAHPTPVDARVR
jgi:hypothetical protein